MTRAITNGLDSTQASGGDKFCVAIADNGELSTGQSNRWRERKQTGMSESDQIDLDTFQEGLISRHTQSKKELAQMQSKWKTLPRGSEKDLLKMDIKAGKDEVATLKKELDLLKAKRLEDSDVFAGYKVRVQKTSHAPIGLLSASRRCR